MTMTDGVGASHQGRKLIKAYQSAVERKRVAERELNSASCAKTNATNDLARWIMPKDAKPGEKFSIWDQDMHGNECLFEVTAPQGDGYANVAMRYRK
jgi:hypothetical protein